MDAGEVVGPYVCAQATVVARSLTGVTADAPDAIHATRVAARRLRSALQTFRPLWVGGHRELRSELRWYAGVLSAARDLEVVAAWFSELSAEPVVRDVPGSAEACHELVDTLSRDRATSLASLRETLADDRFERLVRLLALDDWSPAAQANAEPLLGGLAAVPALRCAAEAAALPAGPRRAVAVHELRKTAKAARCAADVLGADAADASAAWKRVTETLGAAQDAQVGRRVLDEVRAAAPTRSAVWDALDTLVADRAAVAEQAGLRLVPSAVSLSVASAGNVATL